MAESGKNSIKRYILIAAVVAIWGIVGYKIFDFLKADDSSTVDITHGEEKIPEKSITKKDYTLLLNYPDPFLKENQSAATVAVEPTTPLPARVMWPQLRYSGFLTNGKNMVAVIELNGSYRSVKQGDEINGMTVLKIYRDSIRLKYKHETKSFSR